MSYEVIFESGSLKGKRWRIPEGGTLAIGRSHSCSVRPTEPDVSGKHCALHEIGGKILLEVQSSHKTALNGSRLTSGKQIEITGASRISLGGSLVFRIAGVGLSEAETGEVASAETGTLGTGTLATAATRALRSDTATLGDETNIMGTGTLATAAARALRSDTATLGDETNIMGTGTLATAETRALRSGTATLGAETGTLGTGTLATAATRAMPTGTLGDETCMMDTGTIATAATRVATGELNSKELQFRGREESETSLLNGVTSPSIGADGETTEPGGDDGETQMLATQMASPEELQKLKAAYEQKKTRKTAKKTVLLGIAVAVAVGVSIWFNSHEPEKYLKMEGEKKQTLLVPALLSGQKSVPGGVVGVSLPKEGTKILKNADGLFEAVVPVGKKGDVFVNVVFEAFSDKDAIHEDRAVTFDRYLENTEAMLPALDEMVSLPDDDFIGGKKGLRRGIPCSRREYWCSRKGKSVYGVISFFRYGTLCFAFRREIAAYERARAQNLFLETSVWIFTDAAGEFTARQWEGAEGAGTSSPAAELARCEERLRVDSTSDWQTVEDGLRNVLVSIEGNEAETTLRDRALGLLGELRKAKTLHWQKLAARRQPLPEKAEGKSDAAREAAALDALARKDFGSPAEEWYYLARRREWWK